MAQNALHNEISYARQAIDVRVLESAYFDCEIRMGRPATDAEVCTELGIGLKDLYQHLERYRSLSLGNYEELPPQPGESEGTVKYAPLRGVCFQYNASKFRSALTEAVNALPKNEQLVVFLRYREKQTWPEIASHFGFSEARVALIHTAALLRIRPKLAKLEQTS